MKLTLNKERAAVLNMILNRTYLESDPRIKGLKESLYFVLKKVDLLDAVENFEQEKIVIVNGETVELIIKQFNQNKIEALWNIGFSSGIKFVLSVFNEDDVLLQPTK